MLHMKISSLAQRSAIANWLVATGRNDRRDHEGVIAATPSINPTMAIRSKQHPCRTGRRYWIKTTLSRELTCNPSCCVWLLCSATPWHFVKMSARFAKPLVNCKQRRFDNLLDETHKNLNVFEKSDASSSQGPSLGAWLSSFLSEQKQVQHGQFSQFKSLQTSQWELI